jgi:hypothetical protein
MHTIGVAGHAVATTRRNTWLQVRNGCMAEVAITAVGDSDRRITGATRIMTACAGCPIEVLNATDSHIPGSCMIRVSQRFI